MATNKVTYNVGTSNKFSAFYEDTDLSTYSRQSEVVTMKPMTYPRGGVVPGYQYKLPYVVPAPLAAKDTAENVPSYTDDNLLDTRAKSRRPSRRFRGNPNSARKFDRVSGTGRGKEIKKHGEGGHNWGSMSRESKQPNEDGEVEENELAADMKNMTLNGNSHNEKEHKEKADKTPKNDMMDFASYKLLQQSKRTNLPTFTVNDKKDVKTDAELQNGGYVKYVKQALETRTPEKKEVKVLNSQPTNPTNVLPNFPSSFRDRRSKPRNQTTDKRKDAVGLNVDIKLQKPRVRVKAPDLTDLKMFPCLDLKS